ncbi:MAG TPA: xanthine dehydrogenase accessory protein XdhC [Syntrophales bacterium]|nr:xanthine dehydrogenase accessory protein XdhC [Syntrophales bacterium]
MNDLELFEEIVRLARGNTPCALVIVIESKGSAPRKSGAKMIVKADGGTLGTIGGGKVELEAIEAAQAAIAGGRPAMLNLELTEAYGHVCGGSLRVYIEPLGLAPRLIIFGAGHVGRALATVARFAGFRVSASDERAEYATKEQVPDALEILPGSADNVLTTLHVVEDTFLVIATHNHEGDFAAVRAALKTPARYIGLVGSKRKREVLFKELKAEGFSAEDLARLHTPVGLPIGGDSPEEIAVSIVAQLIQIRTSRGN